MRMFGKLAFRNVKRQMGNYLIYYITVSLTIALMFAFNSVVTSPDLAEKARSFSDIAGGLVMISVMMALIVAFVLGYASSFLLKLRKREFGTYLTMGMTRFDMILLFTMETLIIGLISLVTGILAGIFLYQVLMSLLSSLMEISYSFSSYSLYGFLMTAGLVLLVFLLSSVTCALYLFRVSIYDLIHGSRKNEKPVRHPMFWFFVTLLSIAGIVAGAVMFYQEMIHIFRDMEALPGRMLMSLLILAVSVFFIHVGASRCLADLMLRFRTFCSRGTNTFVLRQLSGKLRSNSILIGIVAFLITFAVIGSDFSLLMKTFMQSSTDHSYPFDVNAEISASSSPAVSISEAEQILEKYDTVEDRTDYTVYTNHQRYFFEFTPWRGDGFEGLVDSYISESDFNRVQKALGQKTLHLEDTFWIYSSSPQIQSLDFRSAAPVLNGKTYTYGGMISSSPYIVRKAYFLIIVPDEAVKQMAPLLYCSGFSLKGGEYDIADLEKEFLYETPSLVSDRILLASDYEFKQSGWEYASQASGIFVLGALYIAVIFIFLAMAVLALKILSGVSEDKRKYRILTQIGADRMTASKALFCQIFVFFILPFVLPLLSAIPCAVIGQKACTLLGYVSHPRAAYFISGGIALVILAGYLLYFTVTYLTARRHILEY